MKTVGVWLLLVVGSACATAGDDTYQGIDASGGSPDARPPIGGADAPQLPDARLMVDASGGTPDAMVSAGCTTMATWGDQGPVDGNASESIDLLSGEAYRKLFVGPLEGVPGDHLVIDLWDGYGAFSGGFRTGSFTLSGAETSWEDCGVCVRVEADYDGGPSFTDHYMATGGTVNLTSVDGRITGTITNVTFRHIVVNMGPPETSMPHADGCMSLIVSGTFDELLL
jgi:hypothetical protein